MTHSFIHIFFINLHFFLHTNTSFDSHHISVVILGDSLHLSFSRIVCVLCCLILLLLLLTIFAKLSQTQQTKFRSRAPQRHNTTANNCRPTDLSKDVPLDIFFFVLFLFFLFSLCIRFIYFLFDFSFFVF